MEGGQKVQVPLDAGLDVHSSDMLVSLQDPKFQHNRQRFQGKYMPSSLRFEHDGWAAGWHVYQFKVNEYTVPTSPKGYEVGRQKLNDNNVYLLNIIDINGKKQGTITYSSGNQVIYYDTDTASISDGVLTGKIGSKTFRINVTPRDLSIRPGNVGSNIELSDYSVSANGNVDIKLKDKDSEVSLDFKGLQLPGEMTNTDGGYVLADFVRYDDGKAMWSKDGFTFTVEANTMTVVYDDVEKANVKVTDNFSGAVYSGSSAAFKVNPTFTDTPQFQTTDFYPFFHSVNAAPFNNAAGNGANTGLAFNQWNSSSSDLSATDVKMSDRLYRNIISHSGSDVKFNRQTVVQKVPVWFGVHIKDPGYKFDSSLAKKAGVINSNKVLRRVGPIHTVYERDNDTHDTDIQVTFGYSSDGYKQYDSDVTTVSGIKIYEHCFDNDSDEEDGGKKYHYELTALDDTNSTDSIAYKVFASINRSLDVNSDELTLYDYAAISGNPDGLVFDFDRRTGGDNDKLVTRACCMIRCNTSYELLYGDNGVCTGMTINNNKGEYDSTASTAEAPDLKPSSGKEFSLITYKDAVSRICIFRDKCRKKLSYTNSVTISDTGGITFGQAVYNVFKMSPKDLFIKLGLSVAEADFKENTEGDDTINIVGEPLTVKVASTNMDTGSMIIGTQYVDIYGNISVGMPREPMYDYSEVTNHAGIDMFFSLHNVSVTVGDDDSGVTAVSQCKITISNIEGKKGWLTDDLVCSYNEELEIVGYAVKTYTKWNWRKARRETKKKNVPVYAYSGARWSGGGIIGQIAKATSDTQRASDFFTVINAEGNEVKKDGDFHSGFFSNDDTFYSGVSTGIAVDSSLKGDAYWSAVAYGYVASDVYISDNVDTLDMSTIGTALKITKHDPDNANKYREDGNLWLDDNTYGTNMFTHKFGVNASTGYNGELSAYIYLCATNAKTYMFYGLVNTDDSGKIVKTYYIPGHMATGDMANITSTVGNMYAYPVYKSYSGSNVDMQYTMYMQFNGKSVMTKEDRLFNILSVSSNPLVKKGSMLPCEKFAESIWPSLSGRFSYDVLKWHGQYTADTSEVTSFIGDKSDAAYQLVRVLIDGELKFVLKYYLDDKRMTLVDYSNVNNPKEDTVGDGVTYSYAGYNINVKIVTLEGYDPETGKLTNNVVLTHTVQMTGNNYRLSFKRPWLMQSSNYGKTQGKLNMKGYASKKLTLHDGSYYYRLDLSKLSVSASHNGVSWFDVTAAFGDNYSCAFSTYDTYTLQALFRGVVAVSKVSVAALDFARNIMDILINGTKYGVDISTSGLFADSTSTMEYLCTDTRKPALEAECFQEVQSDAEMQFLRQQWDTDCGTETFWWIDQDHVLVLTQSRLILRRKTDELDDWNGDRFEEVWSKRRSDYITSGTPRYLCTCAYAEDHARLVTIAQSVSSSGIQINVYDPLDDMSFWTASVSLNNVSIGSKLNDKDGVMNTYSNILVGSLIAQSEFTATHINGRLLLGVHMDNNFKQWTLVFDDKHALEKVIQGYGYVGLDGSLTGGELPYEFCDDKGFSDTVSGLETLSDTSVDVTDVTALQLTTTRIVGDDARQWYICASITGIVSHWTYDYKNDTFIRHKLPLNNNYAVLYDSASFYSTVFSHYQLEAEPFKDLIADGGAKGALTAILVVWLWPILYYIAPRMSVAGYLQQTLGQAAYVHYNSSNVRQHKDPTGDNKQYNGIGGYSATSSSGFLGNDTYERDSEYDEDNQVTAISSDELSFDRQSLKQEVTCPDPYDNSLAKMAAVHATVLDMAQDTLSVNKMMNMMSNPGELGKNFTQSFLQNMNSMAASDMQMKAMNATLNSEVTALKSLDMFYSTSEGQKVNAGPGYVNHNFVAQCVAQSVTSVQAEVLQQQFVYAIKALTMFAIQTAYNAAIAVTEAMQMGIQANGGAGITGGGMVVIVPVGWPVALGIYVGYAVARAVATVLEAGVQWVGSMVDALTGGQLNSTITAALSKHKYDVEGKHKYGSKNESFMWPCYGCTSKASITDESVTVTSQNKSWRLNVELESPVRVVGSGYPDLVTHSDLVGDSILQNFNGKIPYYIAMLKGAQEKVTLPADMAYVLGVDSFLPDIEFKNENIGEADPVFPTTPFQDYRVNEAWHLGFTVGAAGILWTSCKDTKILDGAPSNMVVSDSFCGVASQYCAVEVKRGVQQKYLRPWAITPNALALNCTGFNSCYEGKAYHAFDGYGYRIVSWVGAPGLAKGKPTWQFAFLCNDRFKRSNMMPHNTYIGNFKSEPVMALETFGDDKVASQTTAPSDVDVSQSIYSFGENRAIRRFAVPVFSEQLATLPATLRTIATYTLDVLEGVTGLTSRNRELSTFYKVPKSIDFAIGKSLYRYTHEYICSIDLQQGFNVAKEVVPCLGLEFLGATPYEAYFYSPATRQYYTFTGGSSLQVVDMVERFRDVTYGRYDFVNQEVVMPCLATFDRLDRRVADDEDETDNVMVTRLKDKQFTGEVWPPTETLFNTRSWFKTISLPAGLAFQGPNRCAINRYTFSDYMLEQIKSNYGKWKRVPREEYHPFRGYDARYEWVNETIGGALPKGWTHNPFLLVTAPLGVNSETDCMFEWEVTFAWPVEMDKLYGRDNYAVVNLQSETMTPGGKVIADRPTHVYLTKELFTRTGNYGYYSFRYQGRCGAGNRERLHIWSDQFICVSAIQVEFKPVTQKRTEILTQQVDVRGLKEL